MKTCLILARTELALLFYSPIAWLVLIVFGFQAGLQFTTAMEIFEADQQIGVHLSSLAANIFSGQLGVFTSVQQNLYLYVPLMTMGLMSREISSGSIKLLLSSPMTVTEIILGKYLSMLIYGSLLMLILLVFVVTEAAFVPFLDVKLLFSGILGLYLLFAAFSAIGLFMSCLTAYPVVAAISTLVILSILGYIGRIWQDIDVVRDITNFLSITGRSEEMIDGLIRSNDIIYFLLVIGLFVGGSIIKLKAERQSGTVWKTAGQYLGLTFVVILTGYFCSKPAFLLYYDMTANKNMTLSVESQAIVGSLKGNLKITTYVNALGRFLYEGKPELRNRDLARFDRYQRFHHEMEMKYVYYYDSSDNKWMFEMNKGLSLEAMARKYARSEKVDFSIFLSPAQIREKIDLSAEKNGLVRVLENDGKKTYLRVFNDLTRFPQEPEISAALKRLHTDPPKIAFLTGEGERSINRAGDGDYKAIANQRTFRYSLINQGFDVDTLSLRETPVPPGITTLVVADPRQALPPLTLGYIRDYIARGGNLILAGEPGRPSFLSGVAGSLGIRIIDSALLHPNADFPPDFIFSRTAASAGALIPGLLQFAGKGSQVATPGVAALQVLNQDSFAVTPLLTAGTAVTAVGLTRKRGDHEQRIVILGDADCLSSLEMSRDNTVNFNFCRQLFRWMSYDIFPVTISLADEKDTRFTIGASGIGRLDILFLWVLPGLTLIFSSFLLIRRRRK